jgi:eukaryotic-like serine/threonine-protein kinase
MPDLDAQSLADHAAMLGLVTRAQAREAVSDADGGTLDSVSRSFLRKGMLTSWQLDRLAKNDPSGFFYGGCKVLFHLAEGTFARVYRGVKQDTGKPVAIKVLRNRFTTDPSAVDRFHKEAEAGMKLRHPNIVQILEYGEEEKKSYMIMEYVEGANLRDFLKLLVRLAQEDALPLMIALSKGLKFSIDQGVTHRDIKGTNILISNSGEAKLVDFGLATIESDDKKATMTSQRTVDYSALERTCGSQKGDPRSDIYFLGCVFYQMLTGQLAMKEVESKDMLAKMLRRSFGAIVPLSEHRLAPDAELARIVERMMKVELKARYQTMDEVLADLEKFHARNKSGITGIDTTAEDEPAYLADIDELFANRPGSLDSGELRNTAEQIETRALARKNLLCVVAQGEVQDAFRKTLSKMGYRVFLVGDAERAAERYRESPPDAVIFDLDGLGEEGLDALTDMHDSAREHDLSNSLLALILLGPRQGALREKLPKDDRLVVLLKPVKMKQVQSAVEKLVPLR